MCSFSARWLIIFLLITVNMGKESNEWDEEFACKRCTTEDGFSASKWARKAPLRILQTTFWISGVSHFWRESRSRWQSGTLERLYLCDTRINVFRSSLPRIIGFRFTTSKMDSSYQATAFVHTAHTVCRDAGKVMTQLARDWHVICVAAGWLTGATPLLPLSSFLSSNPPSSC